eukprot:4300473-Pleurochrysis_carterae.AAC.1
MAKGTYITNYRSEHVVAHCGRPYACAMAPPASAAAAADMTDGQADTRGRDGGRDGKAPRATAGGLSTGSSLPTALDAMECAPVHSEASGDGQRRWARAASRPRRPAQS